MHKLKELCYLLEDEIGQVVRKGELTPSELDNVYKAVKTMYYAEGMKAYNNYNSDYPEYSNRGRMGYSYRDERGSDYSRNNYSKHSKEDMIADLEKMMNEAQTEQERRSIMECIRKLEN